MAVVAVLMLGSVAYPLLAQGKVRGACSTCLGNMKQIGASVMLYAADYDEVLPVTTELRPKMGFGAHWSYLVQPYLRSERLLASLILAARPLGRAELAQRFWPEAEPERARFYLRRALTGLRPTLWEGAELVVEGDALRLAVRSSEVDALAFDAFLREGSLERAVELHAAPLLADWPDEWLVPEREDRRLAWHGAVETLAATDLREGRPAAAARRLAVAVAADPLRESSQRLLIKALRTGGDPARAERQYESFERAIRTAIGVSPSAETRAVLRQPVAAAPSAAPTTGPERYLSLPLTSLIDRDEARAAVLAALAESRLVTLVGPGGIGKTRLALACAEALPAEDHDLVAMVDLASQEESRAVWGLVARSVRAPLPTGVGPDEAFFRHLEGRRAVLLLDNCEHLLESAAALARSILDRMPTVRILATSREALGLPDEVAFDVPPLDLPSSKALFRESAARKGKRIPVSADAIRIVRGVCEALDGLPLALNLAAGALRMATLQELAEDTHGILGADASKARHRSLRATTEWSYRLLPEMERRLLRSVAAMRGAWTLEFAEEAAGLETGVAREGLRSLVGKSLLGLEEDESGPHYLMLETIREDGSRRLRDAGEEAAVRRRLREAALAWSHAFGYGYHREPRPETIRRASRDLDVVEGVVQDSLGSAEGRAVGAEIVLFSMRILDFTNRYREGASYLERCLADSPSLDPVLRSKGVASIVLLRANWGEGPQVDAMAEEAVELARRTEDPPAIAYALSSQGIAFYAMERYESAAKALRESLAFWSLAEDGGGFGDNSIWVGKAALALGDLDGAEEHFRRAEPYIERFKGVQGVAVLALNRGRLAFRRGDAERARAFFESAERLFAEVGDRVHGAAARVGQAVCLTRVGKEEESAKMIQKAAEDAGPLLGNLATLNDGLGPDAKQDLEKPVS